MMESMDGSISRVMWSGTSKWDPAGEAYSIIKLANGSTVKGKMSEPKVGWNYRFFGEWKPQKGGYGDAFEFSAFEPLVDRSTAGQAEYLATFVDGIGRTKSAALVEALGVDTLDILRTDPGRALSVPGITQGIVDAIVEHFGRQQIDPIAFARLTDIFNSGEHRISRKTIEQIVKDFGSNAPDKVLKNPYLLLTYPRIGWKLADSFAMTTAQYDPCGVERQKAAIAEAVEQVLLEGHTFAVIAEVEAKTYSLIGMMPDMMAIEAAAEEGAIIIDGEAISVPRVWEAESEIARHLARISANATPLDFELSREGLAGDQIAAIDVIQNNGVCLLIGPPGCGKSYTIAKVVRSLKDNGIESVRIVAPTGKAAKRASELLEKVGKFPVGCIPSTTIHKALSPVHSTAPSGVPSESAKFGRGRDAFDFGHDEDDPLDCQYLIIDESSMVDVKLGASLLAAVPSGCRVVFVGDENQLPSVGPGSMLRDLIEAGLPTALLTEIKRSDGGGRVVKACHAIKDGREPEPAPEISLPTENWVHIEHSDPAAISRTIVELHDMVREGQDPKWRIQVISAQKSKHAFACDHLNYLLSQKLNPPSPSDQSNENFAPPFRVADKVIRVKNGVVDQLNPARFDDAADYDWDGKSWDVEECPIVNGDMGTVLDIVQESRGASVIVLLRDPERIVRIPYSEHNLNLAYAVTVHKAQGSGFPVTIMPVHTAFHWDSRSNTGLFCRELFYTGISRAEEILVTVGQWAAVRAAIGRKTVGNRRTRLQQLVTPIFREMEISA